MFVKVSETYDLQTQTGKMGFIGIHTPKMDLITRHWSGALANHKFMKLAKCDVAMACAQTLPADPLQVGLEAGDVAPQDMFNPILYKAVSNDGFNTIQNFLYGLGYNMSGNNNGSVSYGDDYTFTDGTNEVDQFDIYYGLLSHSEGWKKAMPGDGLQMRGLFPMCFQVLANYGNGLGIIGSGAQVGVPAEDGAISNFPVNSVFGPNSTFRGPSMRLPRIPTVVPTAGDAMSFPITEDGTSSLGVSNSTESAYGTFNAFPQTYVAAIILPPAKLQSFFYRMRVTWTVELQEPCSLIDRMSWAALAKFGDNSYGSDYDTQSASATSLTDTADATNASITKVMEGA